ncbi:MAG: 4Fe-4S dicluster domain-containing protein [Nitrososphaerales archaeon]
MNAWSRKITPDMMDPNFETTLRKKLGEKGEKIPLCFQCGVCSGSCPVAFAMDFTPRQIMELIKLGVKDLVLNSSTIWLCAACYSCSVRCPQGVDLKQVMDTLKEMALEDPKYSVAEKAFYEKFIEVVRKNGRMDEVALYVKLMPKSTIMRNLGFGLKLYQKGKIHLSPTKSNSADQVAKIFEKVLAKEVQQQ